MNRIGARDCLSGVQVVELERQVYCGKRRASGLFPSAARPPTGRLNRALHRYALNKSGKHNIQAKLCAAGLVWDNARAIMRLAPGSSRLFRAG